MAVVLESWSVYLCLIFSPEFLQKSQTTKIDSPKEEEKGIKRTSIDKTKRNKSKVSEKLGDLYRQTECITHLPIYPFYAQFCPISTHFQVHNCRTWNLFSAQNQQFESLLGTILYCNVIDRNWAALTFITIMNY